eukprot:452818_1
MFDNAERKRLVKISVNGDHSLTADDTDDDELVPVQNHLQVSSTNTRILYAMAFIFIVAVIGAIGYYQFGSGTTGIGSGTTGIGSGESNFEASNFQQLSQDDTASKHALALSVEPIAISLTQKSSTGPPLLPGIYLMNKAYNMLSGKQVYEQYGRDIIDYTFNARYTNDVSGETYEIPLEFSSIPNIAPSCDIFVRVNEVHSTASTSVLSEQVSTSSQGVEQTFDVEYKSTAKIGDPGIWESETEQSVSTQLKFGVMVGHSSTSKSARKEARNGYSYSFSTDAYNTLYKAEIDWKGYDEEFQWKTSFTSALTSLNTDSSNKAILSFIGKWGSHVLTKMETGSYCKETTYISETATRSEAEQYREEIDSLAVDVGPWKSRTEDMTMKSRTGESSQGVSYQTANVFCVGEVKATAQRCAGLTSDANNPVVASYQFLPIWQIKGISDLVDATAISDIEQFYDDLFASLGDCRTLICGSKGVCTLSEHIWSDSFIGTWDESFSSLWHSTQYCFCNNDAFAGPNCGEDVTCSCIGDNGCCCDYGNTCNTANLCSPKDDLCVAKDIQSAICGGFGNFIECQSGVVYGTCGSGAKADCSHSGFCPSDSSHGITCAYSALGARGINSQWQCGGYGALLECPTDRPFLMGICGSGSNYDCKSQCTGAAGIFCGSIDDISVDSNSCTWINQDIWGEFIYCGEGYVAAGYCGSGINADCAGKPSRLKCCKLNYLQSQEIRRIKSRLPGVNKCVDVDMGNHDMGNQHVQIWDCHDGTVQQWYYKPFTKEIFSLGNGKCLDIDGSDQKDVKLSDCNGGQNQKWIITEQGAIKNVGANQCVYIASYVSGHAWAHYADCNNEANQLFDWQAL